MKRKSKIISLLLALVVMVTSIPMTMWASETEEPLPSYNACDDFSTEQNPSGAWTYQYRTTSAPSTYVNYTTVDSTGWKDGSNSGLYKSKGDMINEQL